VVMAPIAGGPTLGHQEAQAAKLSFFATASTAAFSAVVRSSILLNLSNGPTAQTTGGSNYRRQIYVFFAVTFYAALFPPVVNAPNKERSQGAARCPTLLFPSRFARGNCAAT
jgi:hypothetical protein